MISAKVVADSKNEFGDRITTMVITFPRMILAEFNTHRMFSRNSASSRAIPFNKMVKSVEENPFVPIAWQKDHSGMQGTEYFTRKEDIDACESLWLHAKRSSIATAKSMNNEAITKQLANRLLEPFMWHTVIVTSTEWENFFALRCPQYIHSLYPNEVFRSKRDYNERFGLPNNELTELEWLQINKGAAEIHMMALAECMWDAMNESKPSPMDWHIPFLKEIHEKLSKEDIMITMDEVIKVSTSMCARVSYTTIGEEKDINIGKLIEIHDKMANQVPFHASPFEHCAKAMSRDEYCSFYNGNQLKDENFGWCRNFKGFIQYRHIVETKNK